MTAPRRAIPTQTAHPWRATLRTSLAVLIGLSIVLPLAWGVIVDELGRQGWTVPPSVAGVVAVIIGVIAAVVGIITRIMAIPQVDAALRFLRLSAAPDDLRGIETGPDEYAVDVETGMPD